MGLPDEINLSLMTEGFVFELRVASLTQGSERLFPGQGCGDVFRATAGLQLAAVQAGACALDAAVAQFQKEFELTLASCLKEKLKEAA